MKYNTLVLFLFTSSPIFSLPLQRRDNANSPLNNIVNTVFGSGSEGGLMEPIFGNSNPITSIVSTVNSITSNNDELVSNIVSIINTDNNKGYGIVNQLPIDG
ncbi:hypothetical protein K502DRAFT_364231 [Neoconidiobolus thromboides FSU 785]|nr:hypothetical protein K502DRAFT_364231 [Neoconidiobolus thromboides FSU 785]